MRCRFCILPVSRVAKTEDIIPSQEELASGFKRVLPTSLVLHMDVRRHDIDSEAVTVLLGAELELREEKRL